MWSFHVQGSPHKSPSRRSSCGLCLLKASWILSRRAPPRKHVNNHLESWGPAGKKSHQEAPASPGIPLCSDQRRASSDQTPCLAEGRKAKKDSLVSNTDRDWKGGREAPRNGRRWVVPQDPPAQARPCWGQPAPTENTGDPVWTSEARA